MKKQPSKRKLRLIDETGKVIRTLTLTPENPSGILYLNQKEWMKDQSEAGILEAGIKVYDSAMCEMWAMLRALDKRRAQKLLDTLYRYLDDENEDS